jgi:hypothetical protein
VIDESKVSDVVRILNEVCDARIGDRESFGFTKYITTTDDIEWRFCGALGFGGKFRRNNNHGGTPYVDCYPEDRTPKRAAMIAEANKRLEALFEGD